MKVWVLVSRKEWGERMSYADGVFLTEKEANAACFKLMKENPNREYGWDECELHAQNFQIIPTSEVKV